MSDILKGFFVGMEEFAKTMREHAVVQESKSTGQKELMEKVTQLIDRVDRLSSLLEERLGTGFEINPPKSKRMMDVKKRVVEQVGLHSDGIRPPELAKILGTKVQNLYPHLKSAVKNKTIRKDENGTYFPSAGAPRAAKGKTTH